jgi:pimeloyl-ACP methyl ester carboxylesterase
MLRVAEYYLTGRDARPDGSVEVLPPHEYGPLVLEYEHVEEFVPAADLSPVRAVLRAHLYEDRAGEAAASRLLNEAQRREAHDLMDTSLPATRAKIAALIVRHKGESAGLSPQGRLRTLRTPVYLLHGEADNIIPSAETLWMASELPPDDLKAMLQPCALAPRPRRAEAGGDGPVAAHSLLRADDPRGGEFCQSLARSR